MSEHGNLHKICGAISYQWQLIKPQASDPYKNKNAIWQWAHLSTSRQIPPRPPFYIGMQITSQIGGVIRSVPGHPGTADLFHTRYGFTAIESPRLNHAQIRFKIPISRNAWRQQYFTFLCSEGFTPNYAKKCKFFYTQQYKSDTCVSEVLGWATQSVSNATQDSKWRATQHALTKAHRARSPRICHLFVSQKRHSN